MSGPIRIGEPFRLGDLIPPEIDRKAAKSLATTVIMRRIAALPASAVSRFWARRPHSSSQRDADPVRLENLAVVLHRQALMGVKLPNQLPLG